MKRTTIKIVRMLLTMRNEIKELRQNEMRAQLILNKEYLTKEEAAIYMGVPIGRIANMIRNKDVAIYRPSPNLLYIKKEDILKYISKNRFLSSDEIKSFAATRCKCKI